MKSLRFRPLGLAATLAVTTAMPAIAAVTPEEVWSMWQEITASFGYKMSAGGESRAGDQLVLSDVVAAVEQDGMAIRIPVGQVVLRDRGDGSVEITVPNHVPINMTATGEDQDPVAIGMHIEHDGLMTVVSGERGNMLSNSKAQQLRLVLDNAVVDGGAIPLQISAALDNLQSSDRIAVQNAITEIEGRLEAGKVAMTMAADNPDGDGKLNFALNWADYNVSYSGLIPGSLTADVDPARMLADGMRFMVRQASGPVDFNFSLDDAGAMTTAGGTLAGSALAVGLDRPGVTYDVGVTGLDLRLSGAELPLPELSVKLGEYRVAFTMPMLKMPDPQEMKLLLRLVDLDLPADIWAMVDPAGELAQGPLTVIADLAARLRLHKDLLSPEVLADDSGELPAEIERLVINNVQANALGAEFTGTGDMTFDNTDFETFDGIPRPAGHVDMRLKGLNALLDKLVGMGLIPEDEVMGYRMMLAMFAKVEGDDVLTSRIEITPEGGIFANGQQLQ